MPTIFDGMNEVVDRYLKLDDAWRGTPPRFGHLATLLQLSQRAPEFADGNLVDQLFRSSQSIWEAATNDQRVCRSRANWRSEKRLEYRDDNPSLEVVLERVIAQLTDDNWWNQVPVDSGLLDSQGRRKIDLVHREEEAFSIYELKWNSNNPLSAAIQVVQYGAAYLFFRRFVLPSLYPEKAVVALSDMMAAQRLALIVLAPARFYENFSSSPSWLESFEHRLNDDFEESANRQASGIRMSFQFETFPMEFDWSLEMASDPNKRELAKLALSKRRRVFADR
jgi:hypothetical protein